jgi:queuine/archaeosine tRNA-ribosyltransferase
MYLTLTHTTTNWAKHMKSAVCTPEYQLVFTVVEVAFYTALRDRLTETSQK